MGSTYQYLIGLNALRQLGITIRQADNAALTTFHLEKIRQSFRRADLEGGEYFIAKSHAAFPEQIDAVMSAKNLRVFIVWRDQEDALVSDFYFSKNRAGHMYRNFDDYFSRRGRKILLRNCLQKRCWQDIKDDRVRAWNYMDLVHDFEGAAAEMMKFAGIENVDLAALKESVSIRQLRKKHGDPKGTFFREGGKQDLSQLNPDSATLAEIAGIMEEQDVMRLGAEFEKEDWFRIFLLGRECREAGVRKELHWWLHKKRSIQLARKKVLPHIYKVSPRRLLGKVR